MARNFRRRSTRVRSRRREGFIARSRQQITLTSADTTQILDLMADYESDNISKRDVEGCTVTGIRGWYTWHIGADDVVQPASWIGLGIRTESERVVAQLDTDAEQAAVGPLDGFAQFDRWMYLNRYPMFAGSPDATGDINSRDADTQLYEHRKPVIVKSNRRLFTAGDSLYAFCQGSPVDSTTPISVFWDLAIFCRRP